jgi:divalent metal cation (Fe/Co/Zn/Cd) transporter
LIAGRTKLEPIAIVVLSVIMASASIQMIREAIEQVISYALFDLKGPPNFNDTGMLCVTLDKMKDIVAEGDGKGPVFSVFSICICCITISMFYG